MVVLYRRVDYELLSFKMLKKCNTASGSVLYPYIFE